MFNGKNWQFALQIVNHFQWILKGRIAINSLSLILSYGIPIEHTNHLIWNYVRSILHQYCVFENMNACDIMHVPEYFLLM